ncbi:hypothetical protein HanRHA438_Chr15g0728831 [Helianthus annuus]|nr:hypothetical protein HanRHA438_Chr15g0728831 [Helianthus annuus]
MHKTISVPFQSILDLANGSGWVGSWAKTGSGQNGSIKKKVVLVRVKMGSGRNGFGPERVSGRVS